MKINELGFNNEQVLDRICDAYGFFQKIQLARHFEIAASSLANRYGRDSISYDFIVHCALETGASIHWLLTGNGEKFDKNQSELTKGVTNDTRSLLKIQTFSLNDGALSHADDLSIDAGFFGQGYENSFIVQTDNRRYVIDKDARLSDGSWLVEIGKAISIRELTLLPGHKFHVAGGKVPFECGVDEIKTIGRVVGVYSELD